ncbi:MULTISPECIES: metallophosphoesterase family protein [Paenibacillus]|uniref:metallophosphoesterase family protein n=1 Tax=Paenibacillus TaxID=44249 RepID=UPI0022B873CF|nr:metallophosphoesterase family protein [Paenibacillus caseinilyticus]MCZ8518269.1 metallophosphoesterase family protein [Paenibacillus caseinilyticus]
MKRKLSFREDGTFTVTQFTDVHWKDGGEPDQRSFALMESVLDAEHPDLVVFTGDIIYTGTVAPGETECRDPAQAFRDAVSAVEARGIPWAAVFGNHDTENRISRDELMDVILEHRHTVTERGRSGLPGTGNYRLTVLDQEGTPAASLYFFDTGEMCPFPGVKGYDWLKHDQVAWYMEDSRTLSQAFHGRPVPSLAFFHIPLPEYKEVWNLGGCSGSKNEEVCCSTVNAGMFGAMLERGTMLGTFAGHDHINDYCGDLHGIKLCYGRATGYNTYGQEGFPRGARMIRLHAGALSFDTWVRLDDGRVISYMDEGAADSILS